jgi:O-acetyl-ADP-ribose deacetylase (regulator of RNase III)
MDRTLKWSRKSDQVAEVTSSYSYSSYYNNHGKSYGNTFKVEVATGDITNENVEAIVNPANENLAHSGGCAAAIQREAGAEFQIESSNYIRVHGKIPVGECTFTSSGNLKRQGIKYVIHAVGPEFKESQAVLP